MLSTQLEYIDKTYFALNCKQRLMLSYRIKKLKAVTLSF